MKNKTKLKKSVTISIIIILIFIINFAITNYFQYMEYTRNFNCKIEEIVMLLLEKYPDLDKNEIIKVLNEDSNKKSEIFKEYGIDITKETVILRNNGNFKKFTIDNLLLIILLSCTLISIFLVYNYKKDKELKKITEYIAEINKRNYKLEISGNTEDELSILKDELYKITIMLKEQAENSKQDKISLKKSISDISHQLKTPLTSILIMIDNITDNPNMDKEVREDFIKDIRREVLNMNFLVQSLLKLSRFDVNDIEFVNEDVKIGEIIKKAIQNVATLSDLKDVKIAIFGDVETKIKCDFKWQVEAITNILKNSVEYSENGGKIEITLRNNKLYLEIKIKDNGKGIDEKELNHIFERFYKGKNSSKDSVGIGLALAKIIIEKDNGQIKVESKLEEGTTFIIKYFLI